jgi:cell division protein FtsI (penicillin-binding protein 3)
MESKNPVNPSDLKRLALLSLFVFLLFSFLIVQFYKIQVVEGDKWTKMAQMQHQLVITEPFKRGSFFSNTGIKKGHPEAEQPFVIDVPKFHLYIDPDSFPEESKSLAAEKIASIFSMEGKEKERIQKEFQRKSRSRKLIMWLDNEMQGKIFSWWNEFAKKEQIPRNALFFVQDYKRSYPFGSLMGQLLHTVQEEKDSRTLQCFPTGGLELQFHSYLQGKLGKRVLVRSPSHPLDKGKIIEVPENGADIHLTINHYLQAIMEEELAKGVKEAGAKGAWAVMMDPETGEILAMGQYPPFDPRKYRDYFNDEKEQIHTHLNAVSYDFEPGSIFKPVGIAIGFMANEELKRKGKAPLFHPSEMLPTLSGKCPGTSFLLKDMRSRKYLNMYMGLQKSSNIYMGKIVQGVIETFGDNWYRNALVDVFGFGKKTNIELPAEAQGMVPTPGKLHPNKKLEWSVPTPYCLAMGHNITTTSLQIARIYCMFANGGYEVQPTIVRKIVKRKESGDVVLLDRTGKNKKGRQILSTESTREITKALKYTTKLGGSSPRGDIKGYSDAGKSGSSEKIINGRYSRDKFISSFAGIAPANKPRFVLVVSVDEPEHKFLPGVGKNYLGGVCASPIFREISAKALAYLGVEPDDPGSLPGNSGIPIDWAKEVKELKELFDKWNGE